jgi:hypothetical protein
VLRLVIAMTVAAALAATWAGTALATAAPSTGTLEICKSSLNGMSGKTFTFSVNGGAPITVKGGRCTGPMQVTAGNVTILEAQGAGTSDSPTTDVASIRTTPSARQVSQDLANRKVVVTVAAGSTASNETRVTYVNEPAGGNYGDLKICKLTETPAFLGQNFSFKVNGGSAISVTAADANDDPSTWSCRLAGTFQVGTIVNVAELVPAQAQVAWIDTNPGSNLVDFDTSAGTASVQITAGMTVVEFDNEAFTPQGNGYLEICKDRALLDYNQPDWAVQGSFTFDVTDASGASQQVSVLAGQCSGPLQVAAGIAHVTEEKVNGIDLVDAYTIPDDRFQQSNLINGTVDVEIPVSDDPNDETQLHMVNQAERGQLKICKALGAGSSDLIGQNFYFDVDTGNGPWLDGNRYPFSITAQAQTQCKIFGTLPLGTDVNVTELFQENAQTAGPIGPVNLPDNSFIKTTGEGTITIRPGINTITITNQAVGQLEICKARIEFVNPKALSDAAQPWVNFLVDGATKVQVRAGRCALPLTVPVGQHTVVEQSYQMPNPNNPNAPSSTVVSLSSNASVFELDTGGQVCGIPVLGCLAYSVPGGGIDVNPSDRVVSKNTATRTVTVNVPYGVNGETLVTFYNRIRQGQIKICKLIPDTSQDSLGGKTFNYNWSVDGQSGSASLVPGQCTYVLGQANIIDSNGNPTKVFVQELGVGSTFTIDSIVVQFANDNVSTNLLNGIATWSLGPNTNVVTYTNRSKDP